MWEIKDRQGNVIYTARDSFSARSALQAAIDDGADLRNANLSKYPLYGVRLYKVDFSGANFRGADFEGASAEGCDFSGADCRGTNFEGASLSESNFTKANMKSANLCMCKAGDANFTDANFSKANLQSMKAKEANFDRAKFHRTHFLYGTFAGSSFQDADFRGACPQDSPPKRLAINTKQWWQDFMYLDGEEYEEPSKFSVVDFTNTNLNGANFRGVDFSHADIYERDLEGADLTRAKIPQYFKQPDPNAPPKRRWEVLSDTPSPAELSDPVKADRVFGGFDAHAYSDGLPDAGVNGTGPIVVEQHMRTTKDGKKTPVRQHTRKRQ